MKRTPHTATITAADGTLLAEREAYAWNSAIRASEQLMRELARERGSAYLGQSPRVEGIAPERVYSRMWAGNDGGTVWAYVSVGAS